MTPTRSRLPLALFLAGLAIFVSIMLMARFTAATEPTPPALFGTPTPDVLAIATALVASTATTEADLARQASPTIQPTPTPIHLIVPVISSTVILPMLSPYVVGNDKLHYCARDGTEVMASDPDERKAFAVWCVPASPLPRVRL